ncbi:unnamed protein product [Zymoseptoria tritici ST99CH_1A5]|uniref:Retroviral polymerase SH3-like domain-containing protein n=1 Tax=Zymoseptoria tritici ST99CH_1A5 TaxID=1276529 RepID=A0A1Y6LIZ7_ZYMTR|nr:unnamed protein product [Zymoseptoria tritici ST99CH_1A5]
MHRQFGAVIKEARADGSTEFTGIIANVAHAAGLHFTASPSTALYNWKSPYECLYGDIPDINWIRRVSCRAYKLVPKRKFPKKYDKRAHLRVLVGFEGTNVFRLWDPVTGKVERAKEVLFDENVRLDHNAVPQLRFPNHSVNEIDHIAPWAAKEVLPHEFQKAPTSLTRIEESTAAQSEWEQHTRQGDLIPNPVQPIALSGLTPLKVPSNAPLPAVNSDDLRRRMDIAQMMNYMCIEENAPISFNASIGPILEVEMEDGDTTKLTQKPPREQDERGNAPTMQLIEDNPVVPKNYDGAMHSKYKRQ